MRTKTSREPLPFTHGRIYSQRDFVEFLDDAIEYYSGYRAMAYAYDNGGRLELTYSEMMDEVRGIVAEMECRGIIPGDRVAIIAPTSPFYMMIILALMYEGVTATLIDHSLGKADVGRMLEKVDPCAVFLTRRMLSSLEHDAIDGRVLFIVGEDGKAASHVPESPARVVCNTPDGDADVSTIIFTSGTTGGMKAVQVTYHSMLRSMNITGAVAGLDGIPGRSSFFFVLPLNHIAGYTSALTTLLSGMELDFMEDVGPSKYTEGLMMFEPTLFLNVPAVYDIMERKTLETMRGKGRLVYRAFTTATRFTGKFRRKTGIRIGRRVFKGVYSKLLGRRIRTVVTGASPCKNSTARFIAGMGLEWANYYATTETNVTITAVSVSDDLKYGHSGSVKAFDGIEIRIKDPDEDGIGEIQVRTELIMKGYFKDPVATEAAFDDGWFRTGDSGFIDEMDRLHIVGRIKESIVLRSGKKVSPTDVDEYYSGNIDSGYEIASCGVPTEGGCDEIHLFIRSGGMDDAARDGLAKAIESVSASAPAMYRISGTHFVDSIPKTSVGKIMRFALRDSLTMEKDMDEMDIRVIGDLSVENLYEMIRKYRPSAEIRHDSRLAEDVGLDSISLFNIKCDLESMYNVDFGSEFASALTVADLWDAVSRSDPGESSASDDLSMYPSPRDARTGRRLRRWSRIISCPYRIEVSGLENIPRDGSNYLVCPNHQTLLDPFWVLKAAGGSIDFSRVVAVAARERNVKRVDRFLFNMLGAIPVDRYDNPFPALKRARECLADEGYILVLFPEGSRTSDGGLMPFKAGAAELSMQTGRKILPVRIDGGYEIFPKNQGKRPKIFGLRRPRLRIAFGEMMDPSDYSDHNEMIQSLRDAISRL